MVGDTRAGGFHQLSRGGWHICPICGKSMKKLADFEGHLANWHNLVEKKKCSYCSKEYGHRKHLRRHMVQKHSDFFDANNLPA